MDAREKRKIATSIVKKLKSKGFAAYFVGGCVRDMVMRKRPNDFDITTSAKPSQIKKLFAKKTYPVGEKFGTLLYVEKKVHCQISTFRGEKNTYPLSVSDDLRLRDFTINALAYNPFDKKVIDLVEGKKDIKRKLIRAVGAAHLRFKEDPLRLLRAIRLACVLDFRIDAPTKRAIVKLAPRINKVSKERLREELIGIFTSPRPARGLSLLNETNLLKHVLPEVEKLKGVEQPKAFHPEGDVFSHTALMLKTLKSPKEDLVFSCLFHDIGKPATFKREDRIRFNRHDKVGAKITDKILRRLKFSNKIRDEIIACVDNHMRMMEAPHMREATLKRLFMRATFNTELELHRIDCLASHKDLKVWKYLHKHYKEFQKRPKLPKPLLSGHELIKIGFTPGPIFGTILTQMVDLQIEGKLKTKVQVGKWLLSAFLKERAHA